MHSEAFGLQHIQEGIRMSIQSCSMLYTNYKYSSIHIPLN
jgi:hypothetical protein